VIAREQDCESCRQCAINCPAGAIYVTLLSTRLTDLDRQAVVAAGKLTAYADWLGWKDGVPPPGDRSGAMYRYEEALREKRGHRNPPDPADRVRRQLYEARDRNYI
jgi:Fe-S-cluster-containing hydrogenase component 2